MKRRLFLFLLISVILCASASAAPSRELSFAAQQSADLIREIQPLADAVAAAAWDSGVQWLREEEAPEPVLLESMLLQALQKGVLSYENVDGAVALRPEEADEAAGQLFTAPGLAGIGLPVNEAISNEGGMLRFRLPGNDDYTGAYIYDLELNEEGLMISADIYALSGIRAIASEAPEDSLSWLGHIEMKLKPRDNSPVGFALSGFRLSPGYQAKRFILHEEAKRFELRYPDIFVSPGNASGAVLDLRNADNTAGLSLNAVPGTLESLRNQWFQQDLPEGTSIQTGEDGRLTLRGHGMMRVAVSDSQGGEENCLVLSMNYPVDREQEFSLYWFFIENSFIVYNNSVG